MVGLPELYQIDARLEQIFFINLSALTGVSAISLL